MLSDVGDDKLTGEESSFVYGNSVNDAECIGVDVVSCIAISSYVGGDVFTDVVSSFWCL